MYIVWYIILYYNNHISYTKTNYEEAGEAMAFIGLPFLHIKMTLILIILKLHTHS